MNDNANPPANTPDIELPMSFYLGSEYDLKHKKQLDKVVMYDAKDLTTHGVVVGMTGSGKTGLSIGLLEEAAIDGIPSIIIDPKGDLTNLLLQFPDLHAKDFQNWLNPDEARQKKMTPEAYAEKLASGWRERLEESYQLHPQNRIKLLQDSSEWRIYTPGSEAGLPLSIIKTFAAPEGNVLREQLNQRIDSTATAILGLTGISSDPVQSREHILIAQLLLHSWSRGKDLDLPELIKQIQLPPLTNIGAFDVDTFYPEKDRLKLAIALNNILAAPSFSTWINGEPLDLARMLYTPSGKPRQLIFYIAHLDDSQRQFFVTLLLEEVLAWTRKQSGTTTLRALLYFDEVFGYLPPHPGNPPTKLPILTMLKQARAFGVGVLLATQNPVDIDYKALSNAGTWFIGKLQTERDKARLIEGLEGVAAEHGTLTNRNYLENVISALGSRVFLYHNVHRGQPVLFKTRQALSFLRGPMTRNQVAKLMEPLKAKLAAQSESGAVEEEPVQQETAPITECLSCHQETKPGWKNCPFCGAVLVAATRAADEEFKHRIQAVDEKKVKPVSLPSMPPEIADGIPQSFLPMSSPARPAEAKGVLYKPYILGVAEIVFTDRRLDLYLPQQYRLLTRPSADGTAPAWHDSEMLTREPAGVAVDQAKWEEPPSVFDNPRNLKSMEKSLVSFLYADVKLVVYENKKLELMSDPGEDLYTFQERCRARADREGARELHEEKMRYRTKFAALGASMPGEHTPAQDAQSTFFGVVKVIGWVLGKGKTKFPVNDKVSRLESEWYAKQAAVVDKWKQIGDSYDDIMIKPLKKNIQVLQLGLAWAPYWQLETAMGIEMIPGYR